MYNDYKKLSVLIPAFNEESRIVQTINETRRFLDSFKRPYEIVVMDDGSSDNTYRNAQSVADDVVKVFRSAQNQGKGQALKEAFQYSEGDLVLFLDADLDIHPNQCVPLMEKMKDKNIQVVVGSKLHPDAEINYPLTRKIMSRGFYLISKTLFKLPLRDTQTGIKLFESMVLKEVFYDVQLKGYAFDLELLALIVQNGFGVAEMPIVVDFGNKQNHMTPAVIGTMLRDTISLFLRLRLQQNKKRTEDSK